MLYVPRRERTKNLSSVYRRTELELRPSFGPSQGMLFARRGKYGVTLARQGEENQAGARRQGLILNKARYQNPNAQMPKLFRPVIRIFDLSRLKRD
jgi:hypothetical protein